MGWSGVVRLIWIALTLVRIKFSRTNVGYLLMTRIL